MLTSKARWKFQTSSDDTDGLANLNISEPIKTMLAQRNIKTVEEAKRFLNPNLDDLENPANLKDIEKAVFRIDEAIGRGELIVIYGDYDADGICSTTILLKTLIELGANCTFYIPHRLKEGYGLNKEAIQTLADDGCRLMITVDNGITSFAEVEFAKNLGIDTIITDHHEIQDRVPNAYAIIHPAYSPAYEFKQLAGVGVVFKLIEQLLGFFPEQFLDLVAIGTIADLVPLIGENRILVAHGLDVLNDTENIGLQLLIEKCGIKQYIDEEDVGFRISPRLNATGRLESASLAVNLLMSDSIEEASLLIDKIEEINRKRQQIVTKIVAEADEMVDKNDHVIVLSDKNWHEGVLGIAASRLVNTYDRPVIMLTYDTKNEVYKGSARSIPAFNLFKACMSMRDLFISFGGHAQAAGMTIRKEDLNKVKQKLNEYILNELSIEDFKKQITICQKVDVSDVSEQFVYDLNQLAPFGVENPEPVFYIKDVPEDVRQIGQNRNHLKMQFKNDEGYIDLVGFHQGKLYHYISESAHVEAVGTFGINEWNGNRTVQLMIDDLAICEFQLFDYRGKHEWLDLNIYKQQFENYLLVTKTASNCKRAIQYDNINRLSDEVDLLIVSYLPETVAQLKSLVEITKPNNILVSFHVDDTTYLQTLPTRDDFKWFYKYIYKYGRLDMKTDINKLMKMKNWSREQIIFMVQVFLDLQFITASSGVIEINKQPQKSDLTSSPTYQTRVKQKEAEQILYFSSYTQLKNLFLNWLQKDAVLKEEVVYEL